MRRSFQSLERRGQNFPILGKLVVVMLGLWLIIAPAQAENHPPVAGFGTALQFDGANDYVNIVDDDALELTNSHTIELWFRADRFDGLRGLISKYHTSAANGWYLRLNGAEVQFDGLSTSGLNVQSNTWVHLAGVKDGTNAALYVNGVAVSLSGTLRAQANSNPVRIGSDYSGRYFPGCVDEVRVWGTALSATVVSNWMYREIDPTHPAASNLVAYYKLNDATGTTAADSTDAHDGTLQNMSESEWIDSTAGREYAVFASETVSGQLPSSDVDGSSSDGADWTLTFEIVNPGTYGTATVASANTFTYSVPAIADTVDTFTYLVRDPYSEVSNVSTVSVAVTLSPPVIDITNGNESVEYTVTEFCIGGTASATTAGTMDWTNAANGAAGTFAASASWQVGSIPLALGTNLISVSGTNILGDVANDDVAITRLPPPEPYIDITNTAESVAYAVTDYTIGGTNNAWVVGTMEWTNGANGASGTFAASSPWEVAAIPLAIGANAIAVSGTNAVGVAGSDSVTITRFGPAVTYVAPDAGNVWPYETWANAATTIQAAVDATAVGGTVWVSNGVYNTGGTVPHGQDFTNRVVITNNITVRGVNGPSNTFIVGASDSGTNGPLAVRCVWMSAGMLTGFTVTNGHTQTTGDWTYYQRGGGVFLNQGGTVSNCVISGNSANITGGGVDFHYGGLVVDCRIEGNTTTLNYGGAGASLHRGALLEHCVVWYNSAAGSGGDGGGLYFYSGGTARNCLIAGNTAFSGDGGGAYMGWDCSNAVLESCTLIGNSATNGGGVYVRHAANTVRNCIIYDNSATSSGANWVVHSDAANSALSYICTTPTNGLPGGEGCLPDDPQFVGGGDYHLQAGSPCVDAGIYETWMVYATDLDGISRDMGSAPDMGAYERLPATTNAIFVLFGQDGSPLANDADASVAAGTDFGGWNAGSAVTNTLALHNAGTNDLLITNWTNTGNGAGAFSFPNGLPASVSPGGVSNIPVRFDLTVFGSYTSVLSIAHNATNTPFIVQLAGRVLTWSPMQGPASGGNSLTITNGDFSTVTNVLVGGVSATIVSSGTGWVTFTIPDGLTVGTQDIVLQTPDQGDITLPDAYTVNPAGAISGTSTRDDWDHWGEIAGLPAARESLAAGTLNGALYAVGGYDDDARTNVYRFDGTNWTEVAGLPAARYNLAGATLNGRLYAVGGEDDSDNACSNVYRYDGTNWTETAGLPKAGALFPSAVFDDALYAVGGYTSGAKTNMYRFDGTDWTEVAGLPEARYGQGAGVLTNRLYSAGGDWCTNVYCYDGTDWTEVVGMPTVGAYLSAGVLSNLMYIIGGNRTNVYRFDGTHWTETVGMPASRYLQAAGVLNGVIYSIGGEDGAVKTNNVYRYPGLVVTLGIDPPRGSTAGGYSVIIRGTNLCNGADVTNVTLCGVPVATIDSQSATQIVVTAGSVSFGRAGDVAIYSAGYGTTVKSNAFTYDGPGLAVLGTNGVLVTNGESASVAKGTDFGRVVPGTTRTNTLTVTNTGNATLTISACSTNGADAASFRVSGLPATLATNAQQTFTVRFTPTHGGICQAALLIVNDATNYTVNLGGSSWAFSPTNAGPLVGGNTITITNGLLGSGSDITNVLVGGVAANIVAQGETWVTITLPSIGSTGLVDIVIQSASLGDATLPSAYKINPTGRIGDDPLGRWTETTSLPSARFASSCAILNGALYVIGGYDSTTTTNVYRFDGTNWTEVAGLPASSGGAAAGVLNGAIYVAGGNEGITSVWRFDGVSWTAVASLPAKRYSSAGAVWSNAFYVTGGASNYDTAQTNVYRFDGTNWTQVVGLPVALYDHGAGVVGGALYVFGGSTGSRIVSNMYRYTGSGWTEVAGLPAGRMGVGAACDDEALYSVGGYNSGVKTNAYRFDGSSWTQIPGIPLAGYLIAAGTLNDVLYAVGGATGGNIARTNAYRYPGDLPSGVSPSSGGHTGGYEVVISGRYLCDGSDVTNVTLCGADIAGIVSQKSTQVVVTAGTGIMAGWGDVAVYSVSYGTTLKTNVFFYNPAITVTHGANGTVTPDGVVELEYGGSTSLVIAADTYFHIGSLETNGVPDVVAGGQLAYTSVWENVTNLSTIDADFAANLTARGTPHWWLADYGLTNGGASFDEAETNDTDGDTFDANSEYIADTNPGDSNDFFRVTNVTHDSPFEVYFDSSTGRVYTMQGITNLVEGVWTNVAGGGPRVGVGGADSMVDTNEPPAGLFYRLEVQMP